MTKRIYLVLVTVLIFLSPLSGIYAQDAGDSATTGEEQPGFIGLDTGTDNQTQNSITSVFGNGIPFVDLACTGTRVQSGSGSLNSVNNPFGGY